MTATVDSVASLTRWFLRQQRAGRRYVSLHNLVFGTDMLRYLFYRTRYMLAVSFLRITLHIAEFTLLIYALPTVMYHAMIFRLISLAIESAWWGTTDTMRQEIRFLRKQRDLIAIQQEMTGWLTLALILSCVVWLGFIAAAWFGGEHYLPFEVLIIAMGFQTGVRVIGRTFYSGAYAMRRVFMPIECILGPEIIVFLLGFMLRSWFSDWSVAICLIVSTMVTTAISYRYVRHVTDFLRITPQRFFARRLWSHVLKRHQLKVLLIPAVAALGMRLHDVLLIGALQYISLAEPGAQALLFSFYLIMPLLRSCINWAQLMYFDLSKYSLDLFARFRTTLEHIGICYSLVLAVLFGWMAMVVLWLFAASPFEDATRIILPYMLCSAVLGFVLISLFARRRYSSVITLTLLQYAALWGLLLARLSIWPIGGALMLSLLFPIIAGCALLRADWNPPSDPIEPYLRWLSLLCAEKTPLHIFKLVFHRSATRAQLLYAARRIGFERDAGIVCVTQNAVLVAVPILQGQVDAFRMLLLQRAGGYVTHIDHAYGADGAEAYRNALAQGCLNGPVMHEVHPLKEVIALFLQRFPQGMVQIPMRKNLRLLATIAPQERRYLLHEARLSASLSRKHALPHWFVSSAYDESYLSAIFVVAKSETTEEQRRDWRDWLENRNLAMLQ